VACEGHGLQVAAAASSRTWLFFPLHSSTCRDEVRRQNDLFLVADLTSLELALQTMRDETDTHWFATDGIGSFNWRIKFNVTLPMKKARLTLQVRGDLWCL
jgi:hypothetical protein